MEEFTMKASTVVIIILSVLVIGLIAGVLFMGYYKDNDYAIKDLKEEVAELQSGSKQPESANTNSTVVAPAAPAATSVPMVIYGNADTTGQVTEQPYVPHPRFYQETGIEGTKTFKNIVVNKDEYLIVGGLVVDGVGDGVYQGYGPGTYTITITNGFISIVDDDWGYMEFTFRVGEAVKYGWACSHIDLGPIPIK